MADILQVWRQIENPALSIDAYLFEEQSWQISSDPIWNDGIGFFEERRPSKK